MESQTISGPASHGRVVSDMTRVHTPEEQPGQTWTRCSFALNLAGCVLLAAVTLFVSGCETTQTTASAEKVNQFSVGTNLVGEECSSQSTKALPSTAKSAKQYQVYCGRWEHPSGRVFVVSNVDTTLDQWLSESWWRAELVKQMHCQKKEKSTILSDSPAVLIDCDLLSGGWPYTALVSQIDGRTYLADGIPASLPAIENTIAIISGRKSADEELAEGGRSEAIRQIEARLRGRLYGTGDLDTYYQLMTLGQYYNSVKDFQTAEKHYRESLAIQEQQLGTGNTATADPMMHVALELSNQERFAEAEVLFTRVERLLQGTLDRTDYARYISYRAYHAANQQKYEQALGLAREATEIRATQISPLQGAGLNVAGAGSTISGPGSADEDVLAMRAATASEIDMVQSLYLEAAMLARLGRVQEGDQIMQASRSILYSAEEAPPNWEPQLLGLDGRIAQTQGNTPKAEQVLFSATTLWEQRSPGERPTAISYFHLGNIHRLAGRSGDALAAFRRGVSIVKERGNNVRMSQITPYLDLVLEEAHKNPERRAALHREIFNAVQLVRSNATSHNIALATARLAEDENKIGEAIRKLQAAEDERVFLERAYDAELARFSEEGHKERLEQAHQRVLAVNQKIQALSAEVQAASPGYNQLIDSSTTGERVAELLKPNEALIQILLGGEKSYGFLVQTSGIAAYEINLSGQAAKEAIGELRRAFQEDSAGRLSEYDVSAAFDLYRQLFSPVERQIAGVEELFVVPNGPLLSLPFGILVTEKPPEIRNSDYTEVRWLAEKAAISVFPSARSFVDLRAIARPSLANNSFIGYGNFVPFSTAAVERSQSALSAECREDARRLRKYHDMLRALGPLPYTDIEVKKVAQTFPKGSTTTVTGEKFTAGAVQSASLEDYRVVYFATHALLPAELECQPEPSLVTSLPAFDAEAGDGFIQLGDVLRLNLNAELVVLSACNTGGPGVETGGESLSGLARAFFFAGARSMVVSHWAVKDQPTAAIMVWMFTQLKQDPQLGRSRALTQAQLRILESARRPGREALSHPIFWGAFTLVGDGARPMTAI